MNSGTRSAGGLGRGAAWIVSGLAALAIGACAGGVRRVPLHYPPVHATLPGPAQRARAPEAGAPRALVGTIVDDRRGNRIGETRSGWGLHYEVLEPEGSIVAWIREGLVVELARAGFVVLGEGDAIPARTLLVEGRLEEAFAARRFFQGGRLVLAVFVRCSCHREILLSRVFETVVSLETEVDDHAEALAHALQSLAHRVAIEAWRTPRCDRRSRPLESLSSLGLGDPEPRR